MTDTTAGEGVVTDTEWPNNALSQTIYDHFTDFEGLNPDEAGDSAGALLHALKMAGITYPLAAQPSAGAQGEADMAFGFGRFVVDTGCYQQKPAVFICPVEQPGEIGASARHLGHDRHKLLPGERVLTFPTVDQAQAVADALVNATPAQPDTGDVEALREALEPFAEMADKFAGSMVEVCHPHPDNPSPTIQPLPVAYLERAKQTLAALSKPNAPGAR